MTADADAKINPGICAHCRHVRRIKSARHSVFYLCGKAKSDGRFSQYPRLPMLTCPGYAAVENSPA